jgi:ferrous iron transport protein A
MIGQLPQPVVDAEPPRRLRLRGNDLARVLGVPDDVKRMEELGVRGGAKVEMVQAGSPCIVLLAGQKLCFRSGVLLSVLVRPGAEL